MKELMIKGKTIGKGRPLICVSVMKPTVEDVLNEIKRLADLKTDMIEWRLDTFLDVEDETKVEEVLQRVKAVIGDSIFVFTFRSKEQGGELQLPPEKIEALHMLAANSFVVDFIDVELFALENAKKEMKKLQSLGAKVIASHHDFEETPPREIIRSIFEEMKYAEADIVKLAVMPQSMQEVTRLLRETARFHQNYPDTPIISMSMGKMGSVSRFVGEYFGSCVTFGAGELASAPGQIPMGELEQILNLIHKNL